MTDPGSKGECLSVRAAALLPRSCFGVVHNDSITHSKWSAQCGPARGAWSTNFSDR